MSPTDPNDDSSTNEPLESSPPDTSDETTVEVRTSSSDVSKVPEAESAPPEPETDTPEPVAETEAVDKPTKKSSRRKPLLLTVLALVVIGAVAYGAHVILQPAKVTNSTTLTKNNIPVFNLGVIGGTISLYPPKNSDSYANGVSSQIYEGLVAYQNRTQIAPLLATGWTNPNNSTWDFTLKKGVTFHDGTPMTAKDVVYSMNYAKKSVLADEYADTIQDAKALSDYKVEITTSQPDPFLLNKLSFVMILKDGTSDATDTMNATGPFELKSGTKPTDKEIQLVAYNKYHGGHVYIKALNISTLADEKTASSGLASGKYDMVGEYESPLSAQPQNSDYQRIYIANSVTFVTLNSVSPGPLQNKDVRQALRESIDINQIIKQTNTTAVPATQLMVQDIPGYDPSLPVQKQNIADAKALLAKAGYPNGISINMYAPTVDYAAAQVVAAQAKAVGITITIKEVDDFNTLVGEVLDGEADTSIISYSSDVLDGSDVLGQILQQTKNYKSATLDNYLSEAASTLDQSKRLQILQSASKYVTQDDVAAIPLFTRQQTWIVAHKNQNVKFDTDSFDPGTYFWKVYSTK